MVTMSSLCCRGECMREFSALCVVVYYCRNMIFLSLYGSVLLKPHVQQGKRL